MEQVSAFAAKVLAFVQAYHMEHADVPVFSDRIAGQLFTEEEFEEIQRFLIDAVESCTVKPEYHEQEDPLEQMIAEQFAPLMAVRECYRESLMKTAAISGAEQYVILNAGYDTFAWRELPHFSELTVFEVDRSAMQSDKQARILGAGLSIPERLRFVPMESMQDSLREGLLAAGFDPHKRTCFSWMGASFYFSESQMHRMFSELAELSCEGSTLVMDYADEMLFRSEHPRIKVMLEMAMTNGEPIQFCCDEPYMIQLLESSGFQLYEELTPEEITGQYLRDSGMTAFEHIRLITAVRGDHAAVCTKERILYASLRLFAKRGYDAVSVRDIAGMLDMTASALYRHYQNKQDILDSILRHMETQNRTISVGLRQSVQDFFRFWTQDPFAAAFRKLLTLEQYHSPQMAALHEQYLSGGILREIEEQFRGMGYEDAPQKALALYAPLFLLIHAYDTAPDRSEVCRRLEAYLDTMLPYM